MTNVPIHGFTIWLIGLTGAGTSTIARRLDAAAEEPALA